MLYAATTLLGIGILVLSIITAEQETARRQELYKTLLHTRFVSLDQSTGTDLSCVHYVVGRRKRRCDLRLDHLHDGYISRIHAILWYDGEKFCIKPAYNFRLFGTSKYPEVIVNGNLVAPGGRVLHYGDVIQMGRSTFTLENTSKEDLL